MVELGGKHIQYGVTADMFPVMGESLLLALKSTLDAKDFTAKIKQAWVDTYGFLSGEMIQGQLQARKRHT